MANKRNYWYVLVLTNYGPVFVTRIPTRTTAEWHKEEKPMELSEKYAKEVAWGLRLNEYLAYAVCNTYELGGQPFRYKEGQFKWQWDKEAAEKMGIKGGDA